jgi:hypothetical protein
MLYCKVTNLLARRAKLGMKTPGSKRAGSKDELTMLDALNEGMVVFEIYT